MKKKKTFFKFKTMYSTIKNKKKEFLCEMYDVKVKE